MTLEWKRRLGNGGSAVGEQHGVDGPFGWELQGEPVQQVDEFGPRRKPGDWVRFLPWPFPPGALQDSGELALLCLPFPNTSPSYLQFRLDFAAPGRAPEGH